MTAPTGWQVPLAAFHNICAACGKLHHPALTCLKKLGLHTMSASNTTTTSCIGMAAAAAAAACFAALLSFTFLPVAAAASAPPAATSEAPAAAAAWVASAKMTCFRQLLRLPDFPLMSPWGRTRPETYLHAADRTVFTHNAQHTDCGCCGEYLCGLTSEVARSHPPAQPHAAHVLFSAGLIDAHCPQNAHMQSCLLKPEP